MVRNAELLPGPHKDRQISQDIQTITDYKAAPPPCENNATFINELNKYFGRFEAKNNAPARKATPHPDQKPFSLDITNVRRALRTVNIQEAASPNNIPGRVLRDCAHHLAGVLTDL